MYFASIIETLIFPDDTKVPTSSWRKAQITAWISSRTEFPENFPPSDRLGDYTVVELLDLGYSFIGLLFVETLD